MVSPGMKGIANINLGMPKGTLSYLRVSASAVVTGRIQAFSDPSKTKLIYEAPAVASPNHDFTTAFVDRTPAYFIADDGTDLVGNTVYFCIENTGVVNAIFTIEMIVIE